MFAGKPIIGIVGGIGSGKSFVARLFGEAGCLVIDSDAQVRDAYQTAAVRDALRSWWGDAVFTSAGEVDRRAIAARVFADATERRRLEELLHPIVDQKRREAMDAAVGDQAVVAFVWDTPLLFEVGLDAQCDAVVFVDAPPGQRAARVSVHRGWDEAELRRREKSQMALDKKREISDYVVRNAADASYARSQVREILPRILAGLPDDPERG